MAKNEPLRLRNLQIKVLPILLGAAPSTYESLATYIKQVDLDERPRLSHTTFSHYRAGERTAPFGLLVALLDHQDRQGKRAILSALVRHWKFRLAAEAPTVTQGAPERMVFKVMGETVELMQSMLAATDPDSPGGTVLTPGEARAVLPKARQVLELMDRAVRRLEARADEEA